MRWLLVILLQVHAVIEAGDLLAITIKHERGALEDFAEAAFLRLSPARVVDAGIHVGVKTVFIGSHAVPGGWRQLLLKLDLDERFDALETVFPRENHANRRAILIRQCFAIHADA